MSALTLDKLRAMKARLDAMPKPELAAEVPLLLAQFDWLVAASGMTRAKLERLGYRRMPMTLGHSIKVSPPR